MLVSVKVVEEQVALVGDQSAVQGRGRWDAASFHMSLNDLSRRLIERPTSLSRLGGPSTAAADAPIGQTGLRPSPAKSRAVTVSTTPIGAPETYSSGRIYD